MNRRLAAAAALSVVAACTGKEPEVPDEAPNGGERATTQPQTFAEQVAAGEKLYTARCASCHGPGGEGTATGPRVVGVEQGALPLDPPAGAKARTGRFKTAADVAGFVVKTMPLDDPGSLDEWEYWAILAFDLKANGIDLPHKLDGSTAPSVVLHE